MNPIGATDGVATIIIKYAGYRFRAKVSSKWSAVTPISASQHIWNSSF